MLKTSSVETVIETVRKHFVNLPEGVKRQISIQRNAYMRRYMTEVYRKTHPQVTVTLTEAQHRQLKNAARRSGSPLATYLRESTFAYMDKHYLVPKDIEQTLSTVIMELRSIGNNINQIAKHANTQRRASRDDLKNAHQFLRQLEQQMIAFLSHPPRHGDQVDE